MQNNLLQTFSKNKRLILAAFLPLLFWAGIFTFWFYDTGESSAEPIIIKSSQNKIGNSISQIASIGATQTDSDNDGLSDWEESVYGTNSNNPDSDGDGYLDGEEVASKRDPLKKGPDDILTKETGENEDYATKQFAQLATLNIFNLLQSKNPNELTQDQINQIFGESLNNREISGKINDILKSELYFFVPRDIKTDLKISKDNSEKNIKKYWGEIDKLMVSAIKTVPKMDFFQLVKQSIQNKDYNGIDGYIDYYKNLYELSKNIIAPSSLSDHHKNVIIYFYKSWKISEAIKGIEENPARALLGINELVEIVQKIK